MGEQDVLPTLLPVAGRRAASEVMRVGELALHLTSTKSWACPLPGKHSRADPAGGGTTELVPKVWKQKIWAHVACGGIGEGEMTSPCPLPPVAGGRAGLRVMRAGESWATLARASLNLAWAIQYSWELLCTLPDQHSRAGLGGVGACELCQRAGELTNQLSSRSRSRAMKRPIPTSIPFMNCGTWRGWYCRSKAAVPPQHRAAIEYPRIVPLKIQYW